MAVVFCDDGEVGQGLYAWTSINGGAGEHDLNAKDGSYATGHSGVGSFYQIKVLSTSYTELFFSFHVLITSSEDCRMLTWYNTGATELGSVRWNSSTKNFEIYTGSLQATGTAIQQAVTQGGDWFNLNVRLLLDTSTGVIDVRHEGNTVSDVSFTGNTGPSMDRFLLGNFPGNTPQIYDDVWVVDTTGPQNNTWPGVMRAATQFPTGKSATNDGFTADSGTSKYDRVNESPAVESSYIYSEVNGQKQGFTYDAPAFNGDIKALVINDLAQKVSAGGLKQGVRIAGTDYMSAEKLLHTSYTRESLIQHVLELNPDTSAAFLTSENPETVLEKT